VSPDEIEAAYMVIGYEDSPDFAIALDRPGIRGAILQIMWGGMEKDEGQVSKELDNFMESINDDDHWSVDRSFWTFRFEIGALEIWRFPREVLSLGRLKISPSALRADGEEDAGSGAKDALPAGSGGNEAAQQSTEVELTRLDCAEAASAAPQKGHVDEGETRHSHCPCVSQACSYPICECF
jgi:hypothetical protein